MLSYSKRLLGGRRSASLEQEGPGAEDSDGDAFEDADEASWGAEEGLAARYCRRRL